MRDASGFSQCNPGACQVLAALASKRKVGLVGNLGM
jgi:hypothetical protein